MKNKKLLVLGASGGSGQWVVRMAKERGYQVRVLVRPETKYEELDGVEVVRGNVLDAGTLEQVMKGQDAVISCIGIKRKKQSNPWSALASPSDLAKRSAQNAVRAMKKHGVRRLVAISAAGVGDNLNNVSPLMKLLIRKSNIRLAYRDFENMEKVYEKSDIDSLVVRPVGLVDGQSTNRAKLVDRFNFTSQIAKRDVAEWMLDAVERPGPFDTPAEMIGWS